MALAQGDRRHSRWHAHCRDPRSWCAALARVSEVPSRGLHRSASGRAVEERPTVPVGPSVERSPALKDGAAGPRLARSTIQSGLASHPAPRGPVGGSARGASRPGVPAMQLGTSPTSARGPIQDSFRAASPQLRPRRGAQRSCIRRRIRAGAPAADSELRWVDFGLRCPPLRCSRPGPCRGGAQRSGRCGTPAPPPLVSQGWWSTRQEAGGVVADRSGAGGVAATRSGAARRTPD